MVKAKRSKGLGLARKLGFPTVNLYHKSSECGVFMINERDHGKGVAFVMPNLTEIHFLDVVTEDKDVLEYEILEKVDGPENGILDYFYQGLEHDKNSRREA